MMFNVVFSRLATLFCLIIPVISTPCKLDQRAVCEGGRFRTLEELESIKKCHILEGNLIISFTLAESEEKWRNFGGLEVIEVTGYVLFYLVDYLTSLELVLPHLRVIRGNELFVNYALVIFGMMDLKYIGLSKLSAILRGLVAINNNPALSYFAHTVDWNLLTVWKKPNQISKPNLIQAVDSPVVVCPEKCQLDPGAKEGFCWSEDACQIGCHNGTNVVRQCSESGMSCPKDCAGGCYEEKGETFCFACKHFRLSDRCTKDCFPNYLEYANYRCLSQAECEEKRWNRLDRVERAECVQRCPAGYERAQDGTNSCFPCQGTCESVCEGGIINSMEDAQRFAHCKRVKGSLEIRIADGPLVDELTPYLNEIERVDDYVRVFESRHLTSLHCLTSLSLIGGDKLWNGRYSLVIHDNDMLEALWNTTSSINIMQGEVLFYGNPRLCPQVIKRLITEAKWEEFVGKDEIRKILNGNLKACNVNSRLKFALSPTPYQGSLNISIDPTLLEEGFWKWKLVGFFIFYQEAENGNLDYFGKGRWNRYSFQKYKAAMENCFHVLLKGLQPLTRYAIYIETETFDSLHNVRSIIKYQWTEAFNPLPPEDLTLVKAANGYVEINWKKPKIRNSEIDHYIVSVTPHHSPTHRAINDACGAKVQEKLLKKIEKQAHLKEDEASWEGITRKSPTQMPSPCPCRNEVSTDADVTNAKMGRRDYFHLAEALSKLVRQEFRDDVRRSKRETENNLFERYCGEANKGLQEATGEHWSSGGLRVSPASFNDTTLSPSDSISFTQFDTLSNLRKQLIEHAKLLSLRTLIPYLEMPHLTRKCVHYLLSFIEEAAKRERKKGSNFPDLSFAHAFSHPLHFCNETLPESELASYCYDHPSQNETLVLESEPRPVRIQVGSSTIYTIKIKACYLPDGPVKVCPQMGCRKLCSFHYAKRQVQVTRDVWKPEDDLRVQNVSILETRKNMVHISWAPPLFGSRDIFAYDINTFYSRSNANNTEPAKRSFCKEASIHKMWLTDLMAGNYSMEIVALSRVAGKLLPSNKIHFIIPDTMEFGTGSLISLSLLPFFVVIIICLIVSQLVISRRRLSFTKMQPCDVPSSQDNGTDPPWKEFLESQIPRQFIHSIENLKLMSYIDMGKFGEVWSATLYQASNGKILSVAAKKQGDPTYSHFFSNQLIKEAKLMLDIKSYHLVKTFGVVSSQTDLFLVMELMHCGSLKRYLERTKVGDSIFGLFTIQQVMKLGIQIADGMAYLSHKNIYHMDLASRNCLLDGNLNVKVSDFGMSRLINGEYYSISETKRVPYRWMPPEYFMHTKFTAKSDVWSYGIVLWEILNPRKAPYPNLKTMEEVNRVVCMRETLAPISKEVPSQLASLMEKCWQFCSADRPEFTWIVNYLLNLEYTDENFKREFRDASFFYCGELCESEKDPSSFPSRENLDGVASDVEDPLPSTPLNTPSRANKTSTLQRNRKTSDGLIVRCHQYLSTLRNSISLSASSPCPLDCVEAGRNSEVSTYSPTFTSSNDWKDGITKLNTQQYCKSSNSCQIFLPENAVNNGGVEEQEFLRLSQ